ncbi:MAG: hypothetical protein IPG51_19185 [Chloroflexi bacterium]|nr:hypothetical protein [Chloroflexota bacterium]
MLVDVTWHGTAAIEIIYNVPDYVLATNFYRSDEPGLTLSQAKQKWALLPMAIHLPPGS